MKYITAVIPKGYDDGVLCLLLLVFGFCPLSNNVKSRNTTFQEINLLPFSAEGYLLQPIRRFQPPALMLYK
jgi:hypothetical protein